MNLIQIFFRRFRAVAHAFYLTYRSAQKIRAFNRSGAAPEWNDPMLREVALSWGLGVLRDFNVSVKVEGTPIEDPAIFVGNHMSYLDIVALYSFRHLCFVSKAEVGDWPIIGPATRLAGSILVERDSTRSRSHVPEAIADAVIREKKQICIFPEGTTSIRGRPWRLGIFRTARSNDIWIQPLALVYRPARRAAYIDKDTLLFHMWHLISSEPIELSIKFFPARKITDPDADMRTIEAEIRAWVDPILNQQGLP